MEIPLPEMLFGNNELSLLHEESGECITFTALEALKLVDASADSADRVKVSIADIWSRSNAQNQITQVIKPYDWTYTTAYCGSHKSDRCFEEAPTNSIDLKKLMQPDPILFYDELVLFEDELADNGVAMLTVRVRVMPTCFLVLQRFFLRVDGVMVRINDTRLYHEFGSHHLIREYSSRDASYDELRTRLPPSKGEYGGQDLTPLMDSNWVSTQLDAIGRCKTSFTQRLALQ